MKKEGSLRVLLFGKDGQIGASLKNCLSPALHIQAYGHTEADLTDHLRISQIIHSFKPDIILNAAAYTHVDQAERHPHTASMVNDVAVRHLAREARSLNAWLIHYSTDYVFDGKKNGAYATIDQANPISVYGKTKLAGEKAITEEWDRYLIFRTSWVYSARGDNFATKILRLAAQKRKLEVSFDQRGVPASADFVANMTAQVIEEDRFIAGLYHLVPKGYTTRFDYARYLVTRAHEVGIPLELSPSCIFPVHTNSSDGTALRPANSMLNPDLFEKVFSKHLPHWTSSVNFFIDEMKELMSR